MNELAWWVYSWHRNPKGVEKSQIIVCGVVQEVNDPKVWKYNWYGPLTVLQQIMLCFYWPENVWEKMYYFVCGILEAILMIKS